MTVVDDNGDIGGFPFRCPSCFAELPEPPEDEQVHIICPSCGTSFAAVRVVARKRT